MAGASWMLIWAVSNTVGRPVLAARNRAWQLAAGTPLDASVADILTQFAAQGRDDEQQGGRRP